MSTHLGGRSQQLGQTELCETGVLACIPCLCVRPSAPRTCCSRGSLGSAGTCTLCQGLQVGLQDIRSHTVLPVLAGGPGAGGLEMELVTLLQAVWEAPGG